MAEELINTVSPLYDRVKHLILDDYERLNRQEAEVLGAKTKFRYNNALRHYRSKFVKFFNNIWVTDLYPTINIKLREKLEDYRVNEMKIKRKAQVRDITLTCGTIIRDLKIAKITFTKNTDSIM